MVHNLSNERRVFSIKGVKSNLLKFFCFTEDKVRLWDGRNLKIKKYARDALIWLVVYRL